MTTVTATFTANPASSGLTVTATFTANPTSQIVFVGVNGVLIPARVYVGVAGVLKEVLAQGGTYASYLAGYSA